LLDLQDLAVLIESALWADSMLQAGFLTVRAESGLWRTQGVMSAAFAATSFRVTSFRIWHNYSNW